MEKFNYISSGALTAAPAAAAGVARILEKNKHNVSIIIINILILVKVTMRFYMPPTETLLITVAY